MNTGLLPPAEVAADDLPADPATASLSNEDQSYLNRLERKLMVVRDRVAGVVRRYSTGFFLYGEGGNCKSYTVVAELERLKADYKLHNSRMTGRGLFDVLAKHPDSIHLLENVEGLFRDPMAQGVLRGALWGPRTDDGWERVVTWSTHKTDLRFAFTGGIVVTSNRPLDDLPELRAVATRVNPVRLHCSNHEIAALMRKVALDGHRHMGQALGPGACLEVAEFVIGYSLAESRNLDMRLLMNGFADRLQFEAGETQCDWRDLIQSRLQERAVPARESRAERLHREREVAREVKELPRDERLRVWRERTGRSEAALYRRLAELDGFSPDAKWESENTHAVALVAANNLKGHQHPGPIPSDRAGSSAPAVARIAPRYPSKCVGGNAPPRADQLGSTGFMTTAALLRVSTKDQDEDRQRTDLLSYCEANRIVIPPHLWFVDHESRDRSDFRPAFQRMLEMIEKGEIKTVLIQTFDRFGVSDEIEFFHYQHRFRKAGCKLYSLRERDLFAKDVATVVQNLFRAKASEEEITQKSYRGLDGTVNKAREGTVMGSIPAYGYDKAVYAADGRLLWTAHYLTRSHAVIHTYNAEGKVVDTRECHGKKQLPKRGKSEETRWLPSSDKSRVELVRYIFSTYTGEVITTRQLAVRLNREGYRIYGRPFTHMQVEATLKNPCYLGWFAYNRTSQAHRQEVVGGRVVGVEEEIFRRYKYQKKLTVRHRRPEEWITKPGVYPQLIDDATFSEAQRRLSNRSRRCLPPRKGDRWLKGLLVCGGCGKKMAVKLKARTREVAYICQSYQASIHRHGENQSGCGRNSISHKDAVNLIGELNYDIEFFFAEHEFNLENALLAIAPTFRDGHTPTVDEVKEIEDGLEERGVGILDAVAAEVEEAQRLLPQKRAEFEKWIKAKVNAASDRERQVIAAKLCDLEAEIAGLEDAAAPMDIKEQSIQHFRTLLRDAIKASDTTALSDKLRRAYSGIVLQFRHEQIGRRMKSCVISNPARFVRNPNSWPRRAIGSPCVPPSPTVRMRSTSGCLSSTPAPVPPTSHRKNSRR